MRAVCLFICHRIIFPHTSHKDVARIPSATTAAAAAAATVVATAAAAAAVIINVLLFCMRTRLDHC